MCSLSLESSKPKGSSHCHRKKLEEFATKVQVETIKEEGKNLEVDGHVPWYLVQDYAHIGHGY
jgi:hypothetical protein